MATQTVAAAAGRRKFTAADCRQMLKAGILSPEEDVALMNGDIVAGRKAARRRFNVDEYYAMAKAGVINPNERVELLDGEIITMAAMGSRHAACITDFTELLGETLGRRVTLRVQCPLRLNDGYEPEPDLMVLRRRADSYAAEHPGPADALLVIEVADSSIGSDRRRKLPIYALFGIPEVWLADLTTRQVEIHDRPTPNGYARTRFAGTDSVVTPAAFPDIAIPVGAVMPR